MGFSACVASRGGGFVSPSQTDLGMVTQTSGDSVDVGAHYGTRLSWASANDNPNTKFDVGLGYQLDVFEQLAQDSKHRSMTTPSRLLHGPTLDASYRVQGGESWRQWIGARIEMPMRNVSGTTHMGIGASIRMSAEFFKVTSGRNSIGSMGIGGYVETGARMVPGGRRVLTTGGGLNLRFPLAAF